jgi:hypothetical protein
MFVENAELKKFKLKYRYINLIFTQGIHVNLKFVYYKSFTNYMAEDTCLILTLLFLSTKNHSLHPIFPKKESFF